MQPKGYVHIYTGGGKGKTTAALGLAIRAAGAGCTVFFAQFLKGRYSSEIESLKALGITIQRTDPVLKFMNYMDEAERNECILSCRNLFTQCQQALKSGAYGLVVMDEVLDAVNHQIISQDELCEALESREIHTEAVLTGRKPGDRIRSIADYISDIQAVKHPYSKGVAAREGIEF